jgi:hypothetical protein
MDWRILGGIKGGNWDAPSEMMPLAPSEVSIVAGAAPLEAATVAIGSAKLTLCSEFLSWLLDGEVVGPW